MRRVSWPARFTGGVLRRCGRTFCDGTCGTTGFSNPTEPGSVFGVRQDGGNLYVTCQAVPEPSTYALLVLAAAGLGAHVLRRRRK